MLLWVGFLLRRKVLWGSECVQGLPWTGHSAAVPEHGLEEQCTEEQFLLTALNDPQVQQHFEEADV